MRLDYINIMLPDFGAEYGNLKGINNINELSREINMIVGCCLHVLVIIFLAPRR